MWTDTTISGEPLEYTGRGFELFIGFLIAIFTFMAPFTGAIIAAQLLLGPEMLALIIIPLYLFLFVIVGAAIHLARRYHLSRTKFRGIRFAQTGSALNYGFASLGYILLTGITLGWFGPAARIRLSRKLWDDAYFGSERFSFTDTDEAKAEPVYQSFAVAWVGGGLAYFAWIAWLMANTGIAAPGAPDPELIIKIYLSAIPLALVIGVAVSWHEAVMIRRIVKSLDVGGLKLSSHMRMWDILELAITNTLLIIFTLGFGYMAAQMRVWKRIANRISMDGEIDFAAIRQNEAAAPKSGEGLADGLDLISNF